MVVIKRVTKKKRLFGIWFSSRVFMGFIHVIKGENQEYRANNIEYRKETVNEHQNGGYDDDGES